MPWPRKRPDLFGLHIHGLCLRRIVRHISGRDSTNPVSYYGYCKLLGEQFFRGCIARTCMIYGSRPASGNANIALWLINSLKSGKVVRVVTDQFITPTLNTNLAGMVLETADRRLRGVYHLAGATRISRYDCALKLAREFGLMRT